MPQKIEYDDMVRCIVNSHDGPKMSLRSVVPAHDTPEIGLRSVEPTHETPETNLRTVEPTHDAPQPKIQLIHKKDLQIAGLPHYSSSKLSLIISSFKVK